MLLTGILAEEYTSKLSFVAHLEEVHLSFFILFLAETPQHPVSQQASQDFLKQAVHKHLKYLLHTRHQANRVYSPNYQKIKLDNNSKLNNYLNTPFNKYLFSLFAAGSVFNTDSAGVLGSAGTQKENSLAKQIMPPWACSISEWQMPMRLS